LEHFKTLIGHETSQLELSPADSIASIPTPASEFADVTAFFGARFFLVTFGRIFLTSESAISNCGDSREREAVEGRAQPAAKLASSGR
jgi:hypothetical protein